MSRCDRQRKLFFDNGPSWSSWADVQQKQIVGLLAQLLLAHADRLRGADSVVQCEPEENRDE